MPASLFMVFPAAVRCSGGLVGGRFVLCFARIAGRGWAATARAEATSSRSVALTMPRRVSVTAVLR